MIKQFDSVRAIADYWQQVGEPARYQSNLDWYGHETREQTVKFCNTGDTRLVPEAEALMAKLESQVSVVHKVIEPCIAGGWPDVPSYLAGHPLAMRRMAQQLDESAPLNIIVANSCSAGISARVMLKRGVTILALVMFMSRIRPITLKTASMLDGSDGGETILVTTINTAPLDLATACYVLTSMGFDRRLLHEIGYGVNNFQGHWAAGCKYGTSEPWGWNLIERLGYAKKNSLWIAPASLLDPTVAEPVEWLNKQIQRFTTSQEEEYA